MKPFFVAIIIFLFVSIRACGVPDGQLDPSAVTFVVQTQTAAMWTPTPITPSPTNVPKQAVIVDALNGAIRGADPLMEALDAKFYVTDIGFDMNGNPPATTTLRFNMECEWVLERSCTVERAFVVLMHAFEREGVRNKVKEQIPVTIEIVRITAFDHMSPIGTILVQWTDVMAFANGNITGDQLASRVARTNP